MEKLQLQNLVSKLNINKNDKIKCFTTYFQLSTEEVIELRKDISNGFDTYIISETNEKTSLENINNKKYNFSDDNSTFFYDCELNLIFIFTKVTSKKQSLNKPVFLYTVLKLYNSNSKNED